MALLTELTYRSHPTNAALLIRLIATNEAIQTDRHASEEIFSKILV
jgi:hypothetical protein